MTTPDGRIASIRAELRAEHDRRTSERDRLERLIRRHQRRIDAIGRISTGDLLRRLRDELKPSFPDMDFEIMGPFGLGGEYGMSVHSAEGRTLAHLTFRSCDGPDAVLVDTSRETGRYAHGTLGRMNGLHHPSSPLPDDLSQLVDRIQRDIAKTLGTAPVGKGAQ